MRPMQTANVIKNKTTDFLFLNIYFSFKYTFKKTAHTNILISSFSLMGFYLEEN